MKKISNKAFTLVELMVVMTIMIIMTLAAYAPYQFYQTKQKVRNSAKIVTQSLYEARNMAINGTSSGSYNVDIGVLFASGATDIVYYQREYSDDNSKSFTELKRVSLAQGVEITGVESGNSGFFGFNSISGSGTYSKDQLLTTALTDAKIDIQIGFKGATTGLLTAEVDYYTRTYVADRK